MEDNSDFTPTVQAQYHGAFAEINRLNFLWQRCNTLSSSGQNKQWRWVLDAIWRELYPSAIKLEETDKSPGEWTSKIDLIDKDINESRTIEAMYKSLSNKEKILRLLQDASGKGTSWSDEADSGFF